MVSAVLRDGLESSKDNRKLPQIDETKSQLGPDLEK